MKENLKGWHSRGYLPHFDAEEAVQFITFRLYDSMPQSLMIHWRRHLEQANPTGADVEFRKRIEVYLDQGHGSCFLGCRGVAEIVKNSLLHLDNESYDLAAWVIMPNHVHFLAHLRPHKSLSVIMKRIKGYTAREANKLLDRTGRFWQEDYFDRYIRNEKHYLATIGYIENNPVKAKLCRKKEDWFFSSAYIKNENDT